MIHTTNPDAVRVKRDGERGWHWVAAFDPAVHELFDAPFDAMIQELADGQAKVLAAKPKRKAAK